MPPHLANFAVVVLETGFLDVAQAGLELLSSSGMPASAYQSVGTIGTQTVSNLQSTFQMSVVPIMSFMACFSLST